MKLSFGLELFYKNRHTNICKTNEPLDLILFVFQKCYRDIL